MRRMLFLIFCFSFIFLCSCTSNQNTDTSTSTQNITTTKFTPQSTTTSSAETTEEITTVNIPVTPDDPYSEFIKNKYEDFYNAMIKHDPDEFQSSSWYGESYYFLYDLDDNGIDELILGDWIRITDYHDDSGAPRKILITSIYTIENDEVVNLDDQLPGRWNWYNSDYMLDKCILSNDLIRQTTGGKEYPTLYYYYIEEGKLRLKYGLFAHVNSDGSKVFSYKDENSTKDFNPISEEEYIRLRDEANGDAEVVEINWKRIDEYGR